MSISQSVPQKPVEILDALVTANTGFTLAEIPEEMRQKAIAECTSVLQRYIVAYVKEHHGSKPSLQLKSVAFYQTPELFEKKPKLEDMYFEAFNAYLETVV